MNGDNVRYFNSFEVENIAKETRQFIDNKNIATSIYQIQENDSIACGYFCIGFTHFMLKGKSLLN